MKILKTTEASKNIYKLIDQVNMAHEPIEISGENNNAVLVSKDDWRIIQETQYLTSILGMRESIIEGMKTPIKETSNNLEW